MHTAALDILLEKGKGTDELARSRGSRARGEVRAAATRAAEGGAMSVATRAVARAVVTRAARAVEGTAKPWGGSE